jgi:hypothetical protein
MAGALPAGRGVTAGSRAVVQGSYLVPGYSPCGCGRWRANKEITGNL